MISTQVIAGIAIVIILLIVLLTVGGDGGNQGSGNNTPGYCKARTSAEINQCVRPVWRYYLLFWPPRRSTRVLGVLAGGVLGLLTRTFDFAQASATQCLPLWTDNTINGCSTPQEYCTNCDDSYHWCCTTNNCAGLCGNQIGARPGIAHVTASARCRGG